MDILDGTLRILYGGSILDDVDITCPCSCSACISTGPRTLWSFLQRTIIGPLSSSRASRGKKRSNACLFFPRPRAPGLKTSHYLSKLLHISPNRNSPICCASIAAIMYSISPSHRSIVPAQLFLQSPRILLDDAVLCRRECIEICWRPLHLHPRIVYSVNAQPISLSASLTCPIESVVDDESLAVLTPLEWLDRLTDHADGDHQRKSQRRQSCLR